MSVHWPLLQSLLAVVVAFVAASVFLPAIIWAASRWQLFDDPTDARRIHTRPIPRLGGIGVVAASIVAIVVVGGLSKLLKAPTSQQAIGATPMMIALAIVFLTGVIDDLRGVSPRMKLIAQSAAGIILLWNGFAIQPIALSTSAAGVILGWLAPVIALVWLVGITNAFNLVDGVDGLAGIVALIAAAACIGVEGLGMHRPLPIATLALIGATIGFLRFNVSPAKIFLGDSGSMTIGFFLAAQTITSASEPNGRLFIAIPLFCLAFPILDTAIAIARRWIRSDPLSRADGRHVHHQLLALGLPPRTTVGIIGLFSAGFAGVGLSIAFLPPAFTLMVLAAALAVLCVTLAYGLKWLGYIEFVEFGASVVSVVRNVRHALREKLRAAEVAAQLAEARTFEELQLIVARLADDIRLLDIEVVALADALRSHRPSRQRLSLHKPTPVRLDYPFTWESSAGAREMVLRIWYARSRTGSQHTAERVALRLVPALEQWFGNVYGLHGRDRTLEEVPQHIGLQNVATYERNAAN